MSIKYFIQAFLVALLSVILCGPMEYGYMMWTWMDVWFGCRLHLMQRMWVIFFIFALNFCILIALQYTRIQCFNKKWRSRFLTSFSQVSPCLFSCVGKTMRTSRQVQERACEAADPLLLLPQKEREGNEASTPGKTVNNVNSYIIALLSATKAEPKNSQPVISVI